MMDERVNKSVDAVSLQAGHISSAILEGGGQFERNV